MQHDHLLMTDGSEEKKQHTQDQVQTKRRQIGGAPAGDELARELAGPQPQTLQCGPETRIGVRQPFERLMHQLLGARHMHIGLLAAVAAEVA